MRRIVISTLVGLALAVSAGAQVTQETTTTTSYSGTVSSLSPSSSTIIMKPGTSVPPGTSLPAGTSLPPGTSVPPGTRYVYTEHTEWQDSSGNTVPREAVQNQPVTVYYEKQGDQMVVTKVITQKTQTQPAPVIEKRTTTTTTTESR